MFIDQAGRAINDGSYVHNGQGFGIADTLSDVHYDPNIMRPFIDDKGERCVIMNVGKRYNNQTSEYEPKYKKVRIAKLMERGIYSPVFNSTMIRAESWRQIDSAVIKATRQRLRAWDDLKASSSVGGFDAMAKLTYEYQAMSDVGEAVQDMDTLSDGRNDAPLFKLRSVPLPITHSDFFFSKRQLAVHRQTGSPLDLTMAEMAGRRVAEMIERQTIGVESGMTYGTRSSGFNAQDGTSTVYGYTNFPYRVTKTDLTTPTGSNPEAVVQDVMEMIETMYANGFYGPFMLYHSTPYSLYLNSDYFRSGSTSAVRTLRERVMEVEGLAGIRRLDYLTSGYQLILVQMTSDVAQAINGMGITTVMWESQGGMRVNFKVLCIQVPLIKAPYNGVAGIIHGTTS